MEKYFFYGMSGQLMGEYERAGTSGLTLNLVKRKLYFGGQLIRDGDESVIVDRLGSVALRGDVDWYNYPYGETARVARPEQREMFATYYRDELSNLDYAQQRYYSSQFGRFATPDPYRASGGPADPQSWNRYAYVQNDPVNFVDPSGLTVCDVNGNNCYDSITVTATALLIASLGGGSNGEVNDTWHIPQLMALPDMDMNWQSGGADNTAELQNARARSQLPPALSAALEGLLRDPCRNMFGSGEDPAAVLADLNERGNIKFVHRTLTWGVAETKLKGLLNWV